MSPHPDVALRASGLTKRYGDLTAVDGLSFEVARGEIFGFLGPNGAGKTTALKMLCGLLRPDAGHVEIDGVWRESGAAASPSSTGVAPQSTAIWETLTCFEQLDFMGRMYGLSGATARRRSAELLAVLGLTEKARKLGRTLSGGMQRRLNIALALVHQPAILFLDEPQAGLDPQSRLLVREYIRALAGSMTVVLTTHDMEEAEKLSDRVCIIDRGRLLVLETIDRIKARIGEGDLFEIEVAGEPGPLLDALARRLKDDIPSLTTRDRGLHFTTTDAGATLPSVLAAVRSHGLGVAHVRVRERTLEDVFIHLTGRGLRE